MAGHSKWKNIQFRKSEQDSIKSKVYTKFSREIINAASKDPNMETNLQLKTVVQLAKSNGVPKDVIDKALNKAKNSDLIMGKKIIYEGFSSDNIAFLIVGFTDNPTRTSGEIKHAFSKFNGNMSSTSYLFQHIGIGIINDTIDNVLDLFADLIIDIEVLENNNIFISFDPKNLFIISNKSHNLIECKVIYDPIDSNLKPMSANALKILNMLNDIKDVEEIFTNGEN